ncbi:MAG: hypothetical protein ACLRFL_00305 [Clostridia bacterium]
MSLIKKLLKKIANVNSINNFPTITEIRKSIDQHEGVNITVLHKSLKSKFLYTKTIKENGGTYD